MRMTVIKMIYGIYCSNDTYPFACWVIFNALTFKNHFQECCQSVKRFGSRSGLMFCWSSSGSKMFAKVISRQQKSPLAWKELDTAINMSMVVAT